MMNFATGDGRFSTSRTFLYFSVFFATGVFVGSYQAIEFFWVYIILALGLFSLPLILKYKTLWPIMPLVLISFSLGLWRINISYQSSEFEDLFNSKQVLEAVIISDVDRRPDKQLLTVRPTNAQQNLLVTTSTYGDYSYGDYVVVTGKIKPARQFDDFDYQKYLERFNVYGLMSYPKILVLKKHQASIIRDKVFQTKYFLVSRLARYTPEPNLSLLLGILIGARKTLPLEIVNNFTATGVSHIVAVSGYNISIIILALEKMSWWIGRKPAFWTSLIIISMFVIMTGASSSVIRAAVMGSLVLFGFASGRLYSITPSLFFAVIIMLLFNPKILFWDIGFQLSFLATCGIIYILPMLEQLTEKFGELFNLKSYFLTTCSAIIATTPLILFNFEKFSIVAPLVNVLVLPVVPPVMLFGFLSLLPLVGSGFAWFSTILIEYILFITSYFARLSYANLSISIPTWLFAVMLCLLFILFWLGAEILQRNSSLKKQ